MNEIDDKKPNRKKLYTIIFIICFLTLAACVGYIVVYNMQKAKNGRIYDKIAVDKEVKESIPVEAPPAEAPLAEAAPAEAPKVEIPVNFEELWKINEEIYAWIEIPGTKVNYPIVQSADDDGYYLNTTIEGNQGMPGSIFTESLNNKDFSDGNTLIYGHNMKDGTMFGELKKYKDKSFLEENKYIYIYTPEQILRYEIFAAVIYDDRSILHTYDFDDQSHFQSFLDSIYAVRNMNSYINEELDVTVTNKLITLSTCVGEDDKRLLVEAVLLDG